MLMYVSILPGVRWKIVINKSAWPNKGKIVNG